MKNQNPQSRFEEERYSECAVWEAMCPEAVDGTLTSAEQFAFDKHVAGCVHCQLELDAAQRGAAWLGLLKGHTPEPPTTLMARILAETTNAQEAPAAFAIPAFVPEPDIWNTPRQKPGVWARFTANLSATFSVNSSSAGFQPRFAMTAAMAFFSIALTLNLMGVRLTDIRAGNFTPSQIRRSFADASASASRNFQNLRVVYKFESRMADMRSHDELPENRESTKRPATPAPSKNDQPKQSTPRGSSDLILPTVPADKTAEPVQGKV